MAGQIDSQNPHTTHFYGASESIDAVTGETYRPIATTKANAITPAYYLEFPNPVCALEIYNASTGGESVRFSVDGGETWRTVGSDSSATFDPNNTSRISGNGFYCIKRLMLIGSAATAHVEVTPHYRQEE